MASVVYGSSFTKVVWSRPDVAGEWEAEGIFVSPYPEPPDQYVNKVWDPVDGDYVRWETDYRDTQGAEYPGSSAWAAVAASYCVETITFRRLES